MKTLTLLLAIIAVSMSFLSAMQTEQTGFPAAEKFFGNTVQPMPGPVGNFRFIYKITLNGNPEPFPLLQDNRLYLSTDKGVLYCIYTPSGTIQWNIAFGKIYGAPLVNGNFIYIAAQDRTIHKVNKLNGSIVWKTPFDTQIMGCSGFYNGHIFCMGEDGKLYRVNDRDGQTSSTHQTDLNPLINGVVEKSVLYLPGKNNVLIAYDLQDLRTRFSTETESDIISPPLVGTDLVYVVDRRKLSAINKITGRVKWVKRINLRWFHDSVPAPLYYKGRIFLGARGFHYESGVGSWIYYGKGKQLTDTAIAGKYMYYGGSNYFPEGSKKGFIEIVDIDERKTAYRFTMDEIPVNKILISGKILLFFNESGVLYGYAGS